MADVKLFKLISSEEILATVISKDENTVTVKDAVLLIYRQAKEGAMSVGFGPYMPYAEGDIVINNVSIASTANVKQDLANEYNRIFGSGIVLAQANDAAFKA
jgi:hypothetical protein